ncbi:hypothetical protein G9A89_002583 [Geosiphon pyriformis]|nr:hypothetical protein G9A89_002583 [Geosiphon pyriformis]
MIVEKNEKSIIAFFKGPHFTKTQWQDRKNQLVTFSTEGMKKNELVKVDQEWFIDVSIMMRPILNKMNFLFMRTGYKKIIFCGHGVGGAYAAIAGLSYAIMNLLRVFISPIHLLNESIEISILTFGQPRTGNIMFARMMNELVKVTRITHQNDYFPHFPPIENENSIMKHHESEIWIGPNDCDCSQNTIFSNEIIWDCGRFKENEEKKLIRVQEFIQEKFWIPGNDQAIENTTQVQLITLVHISGS